VHRRQRAGVKSSSRQQKIEEASTQKSAMARAGNIFMTRDLDL